MSHARHSSSQAAAGAPSASAKPGYRRADLPGAAQRLADRRGPGTCRRRRSSRPAPARPRSSVEDQDLLDVVLGLVQAAVDRDRLVAAEDACARRLGDVQVRLAGLDLERDHLGSERPRRDGVEVAALELRGSGRRRGWSRGRRGRRRPRPARTSSPAVIVHSIAPWCTCAMLTKRRLRSVVSRPARSRKRSSRVNIALRCRARGGSPAARRRRARIGSPPSMRSLSTSQFGRLTRSSLSTGLPPRIVVSRF